LYFIYGYTRISGAVCLFEDNIGDRELLFKERELISEIWWSPSGQPDSIILDKCYNDFYEEYKWYLNGEVASVYLALKNVEH